MVGTPPSLNAKRSEQNKNEQNNKCVTQQNKKLSGIKIGGDLWTLDGGGLQFK